MTAAAVQAPSRGARRSWLLTLGVLLLAGLVIAHGAGDIAQILLRARERALGVIVAHLPVTLLAAVGWGVLLPAGQRLDLPRLFRMRLIKEAVNALLPVAQIGGEVVRAKLAAGPRLPLAVASASCVLDIAVGTASLVVFALAGVTAAILTLHVPGLGRVAIELLAALAVALAAVAVARRLGLGKALGRRLGRWRRRLGELADLGPAVRTLAHNRPALAASAAWHLAAWCAGVGETWVAMWAIGLHPSLTAAFILESLTQTVKGLGFAIPGALGVQEGGYIVLCSLLGVSADQALALSLLRRLRELTLGGVGLLAWRLEARRAA